MLMKNTDLSPPTSKWRYYGGWIFFILCWVVPLASPLIPLLGFSKTVTAILIGASLLGIPELFIIIAIALWGKATFDYFMGYFYRFIKRVSPPRTVSVRRYYIGLVLFMGSFIPCWIIAYIPSLFSRGMRFGIVISFDVIFLLSFFILGGDFWEKIRALFIPGPIQIIKSK